MGYSVRTLSETREQVLTASIVEVKKSMSAFVRCRIQKPM